MNFDKLKFDNLLNKIKQEGWEVDLGKHVSDETITELENELNVCLPGSYKQFLKVYGLIHISGTYIAGIYNDDITEKSEGTVVYETLKFRADTRTQGRADFIVLSSDGQEWYLGIDVTGGECKVVGFDTLSKTFVDQNISFVEYLEQFLKDQI